MTTLRYAELATASNFSFLRGASHGHELVQEAVALGHCGMGIADRNTLSGVVRAYAALREMRDRIPDLNAFRLATGARLAFNDGTPDIIAYPEDRIGWGRLCRLLTLGNRRTKKGDCQIGLADLLADPTGLLLIVVPPPRLTALSALLKTLAEAAPGSLWLGVTMHRNGYDRRRLLALRTITAQSHTPLIAINDVLYHAPSRRPLQDVLTCVREGVTIATAGRRLEANAERHLKPAGEMARLFRDAPEAITETGYLLDRIAFNLSELVYEYPDEPVPPGYEPQDYLEKTTWERAAWHYKGAIPEKVRQLIEMELALIQRRDYARYFLTLYDLVNFAQSKGILCQGRGSAANSAVCFALGITCVDPAEIQVLFARFLSDERVEPPDIDVDFEHERREEVIQYIYGKYGRHRAGIAATVIRYRRRSAIRDVGKAMGLTEDVTAALSANTAWWDQGFPDERIREVGLDPDDPFLRRTIELTHELLNFPRHLSQHVGGFVLARGRLDELVPIGNAAMEDRTFIEWDKDDIDALGLMKVDVLALGMLTCIRKAFDLLREHDNLGLRLLSDIPAEQEGVDLEKPLARNKEALSDDATVVYDMLCEGDSIGVFQVESRAQINMLPRLKPRKFYDLVVEVAIVRPGPIQGDMVHPYLRRRAGKEPITCPSPAPPAPADQLVHILGRTLGVPLFQEQAMHLAMEAAGFSADDANGLRRAMATFRHNGQMPRYESKFIEGMVARGYERPFAVNCFNQIKGFGEYGFPESHAASFAKLIYISSWLKCYYPAVFTCALLNSQPMGFYAPAQLVRDAQENNVEVWPIDVSCSLWDNTIERDDDDEHHRHHLRLGFRQLDGFREEWAGRLVAARSEAPFESIEALMRRAELPLGAMEKLAEADAFRSIGFDRREALWHVRRLPDSKPLPLFQVQKAHELAREAAVALPLMPLSEHVVADYKTARLSLKGHPMAFLRERFTAEGVLSSADIAALPDGTKARTAGVVLVRQRPGKGNAIFMTLEDETGIVNVLIWARLAERFRKAIVGSRLIIVEGVVQRSEENVIHVMADRLVDRTDDLKLLSDGPPMKPQGSRAEEFTRADPPRHPRNVRILPKSRDFH